MPNKLRIALALVEARQSKVAAEIAYPVPNLSNLVNGKTSRPSSRLASSLPISAVPSKTCSPRERRWLRDDQKDRRTH
jgi:hypothetical protein